MKTKSKVLRNKYWHSDTHWNPGLKLTNNNHEQICHVLGRFDGLPVALADPVAWACACALCLLLSSSSSLFTYSYNALVRALAHVQVCGFHLMPLHNPATKEGKDHIKSLNMNTLQTFIRNDYYLEVHPSFPVGQSLYALWGFQKMWL